MAVCHPDKRWHGHGLCRSCWNKEKNPYDPVKAKEVRLRNRENILMSQARYRQKQGCKDSNFQSRLKLDFNMTPGQYKEMFEAQGGVCAICKQPETPYRKGKLAGKVRSLPVDHDHKTGVVRGLLCVRCNTAIARMDADPEWGKKAKAYLERARLRQLDE